MQGYIPTPDFKKKRWKKKKVNMPYKRLQSQGQGHVKMAYTVVASLMLIACLVAESMQR